MAEQLVGVKILSVDSLLEAGIMLLYFVAVDRVGQEESEVRVQIKERSSNESIDLEDVAVGEIPLVISAERSHAHSSAVEWIDEAKAVKLAIRHEVEGNLA